MRQKVDQQPTNRTKNFRNNVPASTLKDRLSGRVKHGTNPGPAPYLTSEEEDELATFLVQLAEMGVGKTKREVLVIV